jgi:hypothetical protein
MFAPAPAPSAVVVAPSPSAVPTLNAVSPLLEKLAACRGRDLSDPDSWRSHLLELIAARQGQANKVYAVDAVPLKAAIDTLTETWDLTADVPGRVAGAPSFDRVKVTLSELRRLMPTLDREAQRLSQWRQQMEEWLGGSFDKDAVVRELRDTAEMIRDQGLTGGMSVAALTRLIEDFRTSPVKGALNAIAALDGTRQRGALLSVLGKRLDGVIALVDHVREQFDELLRNAAHELRVNSQAIGSDPIGDAATSLVNEFERARQLIKDLQP